MKPPTGLSNEVPIGGFLYDMCGLSDVFVDVKGISHITGGGFYENIPRSIPNGLCAKIDKAAVKVLPIFDLIAKFGNVPERDMFNTYNMGVGMSVIVPAAQAELAMQILKDNGQDSYIIGSIIKNDEEKVILE